MHEKKSTIVKTPDLSKLQAVVINLRTIIYIAAGADPVEAKKRYMSRFGCKKI
jgi:hypothetical protein